MSEIKLLKFEVKLDRWSDDEGKYTCKAGFLHGDNDFTIKLDEKLGEALVAVCRGKIAEASQEALEALTIAAKHGNEPQEQE